MEVFLDIEKIRKIIKKRRYKYKELAEMCGSDYDDFVDMLRIKKNNRHHKSIISFIRMCSIFDIDPFEFLQEKKSK